MTSISKQELDTIMNCPYLGYSIFASTAARELLERAQQRHSLEDCRIPIWMNLGKVYKEVGLKSGQFRTGTAEKTDLVIHIATDQQKICCWLGHEPLPPILENVSLGGAVRVPAWDEEINILTVH